MLITRLARPQGSPHPTASSAAGSADPAPTCRLCGESDHVVWRDEQLELRVSGPMGLPFVARLVPREHLSADAVDPALRRRLHRVLRRASQALRDDEGVAGWEFIDFEPDAAHLQVVLLARPPRGSYDPTTPLTFLNDLLPSVPADVLRGRIDTVVAALSAPAFAQRTHRSIVRRQVRPAC